MSRREPHPFLLGFDPLARPARLDDPPAPSARPDDPRTLTRIELLIELYVSHIDLLRPRAKAKAPIDREDISRCRREIEQALKAHHLPVLDAAWLDEFIIELAGWWFEFPLADDVPAPAIDVLLEQPRERSSAPAFDGPAVGWDPWNDDD
jgi:hypothetical protein